MAKLKDILYDVTLKSLVGDREMEIAGVAFDSREVRDGYLFVAIKGLTVDGHDYIDKAIELGATAILGEKLDPKGEELAWIETSDSSLALGTVAANYYGHPSKKLKLVGITGTNGKTTCVTLLHDLFQSLGYTTGLLSTVENRIGNQVVESKYTTPDVLKLNAMLHEMVSAGCAFAFMEVSSHALIQNRVANIQFAGGVFTNISHDHLDYHDTFDNYIAAKKLLFDHLPKSAFALVNIDDRRGAVMLQNTKADKHRFGLKGMADFKAKILNNTLQGLELDVDGLNVWFQLIGSFNAYNLLTAYAVAVLLEEDKNDVLTQLSQLKGASGRFEYVQNNMDVTAIVDYAHTPDALDNVLTTIDDLRTKNERLIVVVGCGGNRDKDKRPKMAAIAHQFGDKVILTSDNPRFEDPNEILDDMYKGIPLSGQRKVMRVVDRREAISVACNMAEAKDIILVAGKGHEDYQEINGERIHFDDKEILTQLLTEN